MTVTHQLLKARMHAADMEYTVARDEFDMAVHSADQSRISMASAHVQSTLRRFAEAKMLYQAELQADADARLHTPSYPVSRNNSSGPH